MSALESQQSSPDLGAVPPEPILESSTSSPALADPITVLAAATPPVQAPATTPRSTARRRMARRLISLSPTLPALLSLAGCAEHHTRLSRLNHPLVQPTATIIATQPPQPQATQAQSMVSQYLNSVNAAMGRHEVSGPQAATRPWLVDSSWHQAQPAPVLTAVENLLARVEQAFNAAQAAAAAHASAPPPAAAPTVAALYQLIEQRAAARPQEINYALALKLLQAADPADPMAGPPDAPAGESTVDQQLVSALAQAITAISATPAAGDTTIATRAAPLLSAVEAWKSDAMLAIPRFALATAVDSYGSYTPAPDSFTTGEAHRLVMYCEVAHFASKFDAGKYHTHLTQQETLFTDDGLVIYRASPVAVDDTCLNQRHDFYVAKRITLPEDLAAGKYVLRMTVTDTTANQIAQAELPITMTAQTVAAR